MRGPPAVAREQFGVFTTAQARQSGWTSHALRHAADTGALLRIHSGVYAVPATSTGIASVDAIDMLRLRAAALSLTNRRMPVSHAGAAVLLGVDVLAAPDHVCTTVPRDRRGRVVGAHVHRAALYPGDVVRLGRIMTTSAARSVADLAREHDADAGMVAADSALRRGLCTADALAATYARQAAWPGARAVHEILALADPLAESSLESVSRLRMVQFGVEIPRTQVRVHGPDGRFCGRVDFYWDEYGVVGEADGLTKYDGRPLALSEEKIRQGLLEDLGLIVVRWGWGDRNDFGPVAQRLRAAFARGVRPDRSPRLWRTVD